MPKSSILIVDDDEFISSLLSKTLIDEGFAVSMAENGRSGLAMYLANRPDVLITDIIMPDMDGLELIKTIRKKHPDTPIIAISSADPKDNTFFLDVSKDLGATKILAKPFNPDDLVRVVQELLGRGSGLPNAAAVVS
jgi:DNA-binding response OmpR family regulator